MKKFILLTCSLLVSGLISQASSVETHVQRSAYAAQQAASSKVSLRFMWSKPVHISDVINRRPRGKDVVVRVDQATATCMGTVSNEGRVYFVADCLEQDGFEFEHLQKVLVTLSNGVQVEGRQNNIEIPQDSDVAWILITKATLRGLMPLSVRHTPQGKSLQEAYGEAITQKLKDFFHSKRIAANHRSCRIGGHVSSPKVSVGDPVIIDGKLVALMKSIPHSYRGIWGGVSESSLAIIR